MSAGRTSAGGELDCVERRPLVSLTEWSGGQFENIILVVAAEGPGHEGCIPSTAPPGPARYMNITTNLGITAVSCSLLTVADLHPVGAVRGGAARGGADRGGVDQLLGLGRVSHP